MAELKQTTLESRLQGQQELQAHRPLLPRFELNVDFLSELHLEKQSLATGLILSLSCRSELSGN